MKRIIRMLPILLALGGGFMVVLALIIDGPEYVLHYGFAGFGDKQRLLALLGTGISLFGIILSVIIVTHNQTRNTIFFCGIGLGFLLALLMAWWPLIGLSDLWRSINNEKESVLLKSVIHSAYPQLDDPELSDFERVVLLRRWVAEIVDKSDREGLLDRPSQNNPYAADFFYYTRDAPDIFAAFMADRGGVWCRGTSYALEKLYGLFGYRAFSIGIGARGTRFTHVFTLVEIEHKGQRILTVQDADQNLTYVGDDDQPLDYFKILDLLQHRRHKDIVEFSVETTRDRLEFDESGNITKYRKPVLWEKTSDWFLAGLAPFFEEYGYPQDVRYMHLFFAGFASGSPPEGKAKFRSELSRRGANLLEHKDLVKPSK